MIMLGDLGVAAAKESLPPAKLMKACAVIADRLHPVLNEGGFRTIDSCVLCSLAVLDFLQAIGFRDAEPAPVAMVIREFIGDEQGHSLGIGIPGDRTIYEDRWRGHLVVRLPRTGWLIDPTLYQAKRKQWPELPGMACVRLAAMRESFDGLPAIGGFTFVADETASSFDAGWFDNPRNTSWRKGPDALPWRRAVVVASMVERFGKWED